MITTAPVQATLTLASARAAYDRAFERVRERRNPSASSGVQPESWEVASAHVVMEMMAWERVAVLRYLTAQCGLAQPDVMLARCLAARLGLEISFAEPQSLTKQSW